MVHRHTSFYCTLQILRFGFFCLFVMNIRFIATLHPVGFPGGSDGKDSPTMQETWVQFLGWEDPLEKGLATHFSIPAWRIP